MMFIQSLVSFRRFALGSLALGSLSLLVACGGGGGGGGGGSALPKKVLVEFPLDDAIITDSTTSAFEISFDSSVSDTSSLEIILNTTDVTALFTPATGVANRTASVYSLSGIFKEGATNCITVKMEGSSNDGSCFTYNPKPDIVLTGLTGSGPFTATGASRIAALSSVGITDFFSGSITASLPTANTFSATVNAGNRADPATNGSNVTTVPHFVITATGTDTETTTTRLIVPKSRLNTGAALQINNAAFNEVIEPWVGELMENELGEIFAGFTANDPLPHAGNNISNPYNDSATPVLLGLSDAAACQLLNVATVNADYNKCKLYVTAVDYSGGTITPDLVIKNNSNADGVRAELSVTFSQLDVTLDTAAFDDSEVYQGALITTLRFTNAKAIMNINIARNGTDNIVEFKLDTSTPIDVDLPVTVNTVVSQACNVCGGGTLLATLINTAVGTIESTIRDEAVAYTADINDALANANIEKRTTTYLVGQDADNDPGTDAVLKSTLNLAFSGSQVTEAINASATIGAYVAVGGSTYASDDGVGAADNDLDALGSYFDPVTAAFTTSKVISTTDHVSLALSENSLNQLLLAVYQSRLPSMQKLVIAVEDLGDIGSDLITATAGLTNLQVDADDLVSVAIDMKGIPSANFLAAGASDAELKLNALNLVLTVHNDCVASSSNVNSTYSQTDKLIEVSALAHGLATGSYAFLNFTSGTAPDGMYMVVAAEENTFTVLAAANASTSGSVTWNKRTINTCDTLAKSEMNLDAKARLGFGLTNGLPNASVDDVSIGFVGEVVNTRVASNGNPLVDAVFLTELNNNINKKTLFGLVPGLINGVIDQLFLEVGESSSTTIDVKGLGLVDKQAWLVLQSLAVDASGQFILLSGQLKGTAPSAPLEAILHLTLTDTCVAEPAQDGCPVSPP